MSGALIAEREKTHGSFGQVAAVASELRAVLHAQPQWAGLPVWRREALDMIALKQARIVCGDPDHPDHWDDIAGYAVLGAGGECPAATHCVGFFFDPSRSRVWLVRKNRPAWQAGRLNGIGGKIEPGETPHAAMVREFEEEAGLRVERWDEVARLEHRARGAVVVFFRAFAASDDEFQRPRAGTDEEIGFYPMLDVLCLRTDVLPGLRVEIPLALDTSGLLLPVRLQL